MKIRQIISLAVGITAVAVSPEHGRLGMAAEEVSVACGHVSTGVAASKQVAFHGGGQVAHMELAAVEVASALAECACTNGVPNFEGAGPRFSSFGAPIVQAACLRRTTESSGNSLRWRNTRRLIGNKIILLPALGAQASRPEVARQLDQRFSSLRNHVVARHDPNWHNDWDRRHTHFDHGRFFVFVDGFWCGLDDGFFPWDYLPYYPDDYYPYDYYTNGDPYDYNGTTYNIGSADSATVQAIQTQLFNLGYYSGSIDGVFGPTTRDAVAKYQIANHLNVTGSLSPDTLTSLGLPQTTPS